MKRLKKQTSTYIHLRRRAIFDSEKSEIALHTFGMEPRPLLPHLFKRELRGHRHSAKMSRSGIVLWTQARWAFVFLNEIHNALKILYQQSWFSFSKREISNSKNWVSRYRRYFLTQEVDVFGTSKSIKRYLDACSVILRLSEEKVRRTSGRLLSSTS